MSWTSTGSKGAAGELLACAHLMRQGWHVYRCASPHAPFDLIAWSAGTFVRVEVKTSGKPDGATREHFGWPTNDEWDLLIVVTSSGDCIELADHDRSTALTIFCEQTGVEDPTFLPDRWAMRKPRPTGQPRKKQPPKPPPIPAEPYPLPEAEPVW